MAKFYNLDATKANDNQENSNKKAKKQAFESESEEENEESEEGEKFYDEDGNFKWNAQSSSEGEN